MYRGPFRDHIFDLLQDGCVIYACIYIYTHLSHTLSLPLSFPLPLPLPFPLPLPLPLAVSLSPLSLTARGSRDPRFVVFGSTSPKPSTHWLHGHEPFGSTPECYIPSGSSPLPTVLVPRSRPARHRTRTATP